MSNYLFTSESVTEGHPDKVCDRVSDAVLDALLAKDPLSRVACETFASVGSIQVMGEITTTAKVDYERIIRDAVCDIGYDREEVCFDGKTCKVGIALHEQSPDIAMGVNNAMETRDGGDDADTGAGDQGMMFGYACNETEERMPATISYAHKMAKRLTALRKDGTLPYLRPDGKTQVTFAYENGRPLYADAVVVSTQHDEAVSLETIRKDMTELVIRDLLPAQYLTRDTKIFVNPTGRFCLGGPAADTGLTGRKIIVDTYGGYARHGGGAFSGKDPTKVDRSAAYMMRYIAKNVVAAGLADRCELQVAYAIGVATPVSVYVDTFGTGRLADDKLAACIGRVFDLRPAAIIDKLNLRSPIYQPLAAYGHMGREDLDVTWEKTDMAELLKAAAAE